MYLAQLMNPYSIEQIKALEDKVNSYETWVFFLVFVSAALALVAIMQRLTIAKLKSSDPSQIKYYHKKIKEKPVEKEIEPKVPDVNTITQTLPSSPNENLPKPKDLPDPGLIFKYVITGESAEKTITIGQKEGTIKTYSTEVVDHHLTIMIRALDASRGQDIYNLPDRIIETYVLDFRREGKVLIVLPNTKEVKEMGARERIYIQEAADESGDPNYPTLEPNQPIRFRLGDRLSQDGKFKAGYFEFHLYTKDVESKTKAGIVRIEKQFFVRLFKIYPGYDTAKQNEDGLFPMIDPFAKV
ncbi:hypothetical protein EHQ58_08630 [Leptospira ognonensis]|uniref:Uncharacterized protein n=1 Tax=Leptospira ognonensis TaxID=2484945 RepID=A0A4R9K0X5_9LEPT|nr:hypothetical protein [Leptospira ognonensis]TGL59303.1 hypothetical protein EHQ58_08630 [Leptospira ognonensis]